ncbi:putative reverse transcriptase domain-containing protein [Tanacetum coccineum]|uniref:Reverse transcriptase domain-containing protein n=1 Tax=Tanacetum coccineum TaxID=301880 RepID=A0ABQ4ZXK6_9ASTR
MADPASPNHLPASPDHAPALPDHMPSTFEVGGPSSAASDVPHPVRRPLPVVAARVALHHQEIEDLQVRADRIESIQTGLKSSKRAIERDIRWLGERHDVIQARTLSLVRKVDSLSDDQEIKHVADVLDVVETKVLELRYRVDAYPREQVDALRVEDATTEILDLHTRLSASECSERCMITCLLGMEERISVLEQRPPRSQGSIMIDRIMTPRRMNRDAIERLIADCVAAAIAQHKANRVNTAGPAGAAGPTGARAAKDGVRTLESNCKRDNIVGYTNLFHELAVMCPTMVTPEYKKIERWFVIKLQEAVMEISESGKTIKVLKEGLMLKTCHCVTDASCITLANEQLSVGIAKGQTIKSRTAGQAEGARGRAYMMRNGEPQQEPNVVTGTFLFNNHYVSVLFDSGADKSFVSTAFSTLIDIAPSTLNTSYDVELADGKVMFLAHVAEKKPAEKRLEDVPIIRDFLEVFPKDLPRILPSRVLGRSSAWRNTGGAYAISVSSVGNVPKNLHFYQCPRAIWSIMADPASPDHLHASPDHAPALPDHMPGSPE